MVLKIVSVRVEHVDQPGEDCKNAMKRGEEDLPERYVLIAKLDDNVLLENSRIDLINAADSKTEIAMVPESFDRRGDKLYQAEFVIRYTSKTGKYLVRVNETTTKKDDKDTCVCIV